MPPFSGCLARRQAQAAGPDELLFPAVAFDLPHHLGRTGQMINQRGVLDWQLGRLERTFLDDRGVEGPPADILAVSDEAISGTETASMGLANRENLIHLWNDLHRFSQRMLRPVFNLCHYKSDSGPAAASLSGGRT